MTKAKGKPLLVGVSGQVGSQLLHFLGARGCLVTSRKPTSAAQLRLDLASLTSLVEAERAVGGSNIGAIYCIGGMTNVDACEDQSQTAFDTNRRGPETLAQLAAKRGIPFVYFSTEYIFDGRDGPYLEDHQANPLCVYGRSKWEGELAVLAACPHALIVRTTVVYGHDFGEKNFVYSLMRNLRAGKAMRVPNDQISTPTYNRDLARTAAALVELGATGIYHVCGPERMDRMEFARTVAGFLGLDQDLLIGAPTATLGQRAPRPLSAGLSIHKLERLYPNLSMRSLAESLDDCRSDLEQFLQRQPAPA
jgi:dTDP-4-dehydrorhamnose reductase